MGTTTIISLFIFFKLFSGFIYFSVCPVKLLLFRFSISSEALMLRNTSDEAETIAIVQRKFEQVMADFLRTRFFGNFNNVLQNVYKTIGNLQEKSYLTVLIIIESVLNSPK